MTVTTIPTDSCREWARSSSRLSWNCFNHFVWTYLYTSKMQDTTVQILNNHVLPFVEAHAETVHTVLSNNDHEYCGRPDKLPYELFLQLEDAQKRLEHYLDTYNACRLPSGRARDGGHDVLRGLQGDDADQARSPEPDDDGQQGGEASSVDPDLGKAVFYVITVRTQDSDLFEPLLE